MQRTALILCAVALALACNGDDDGDPTAGSNDGAADSPRVPACGDGVLDANEVCEGFELRDASCESEGFDAGEIRCSPECTLDTSACTRCGDGAIDDGEQCEPGMLQGETCGSQLGLGFIGEVSCDALCTGFDTTECRLDFEAGALEACNPRSETPCAIEGQDCVALGDQTFCAETCSLEATAVKICGNDRFCYDLEGQGICLDTPVRGEVCSDATGCEAGTTCTPAYAGAAAVSICAVPCALETLGQSNNCADDSLCLVTSARTPRFPTDFPCESDFDCSATGLRCMERETDDGRVSFCATPYTVCAERIPFFPFDATDPDEALFCDRDAPSGPTRFCGVQGDLGDFPTRARTECVGLIDDSDAVGVCVGFCDAAILGGSEDGYCGEGAECSAPERNPRFFIAAQESAPFSCTDVPDCFDVGSGNFTQCLDVGRGPECVRPARICHEVKL